MLSIVSIFIFSVNFFNFQKRNSANVILHCTAATFKVTETVSRARVKLFFFTFSLVFLIFEVKEKLLESIIRFSVNFSSFKKEIMQMLFFTAATFL